MSIEALLSSGVGGLIIIVVGWFIKRLIDGLSTKIEQLTDKIDQMERDMLGQYVRKDDWNNNTTAHEKLWIALNELKEKVATIAAKQD